ncbi:MFS transporter [Sphingomonas sp.]|uniref:MFS transporter n=1 Tax=Sphingomonas sp. TaxID=28214 RepID=UPI001B19D990|nr:MFS transporter [Sphingomonas sp.]MBO9711516.1 MFS transporter [Sphingomonas sp.]
MSEPRQGVFRALANSRNFRIWSAGAIVSNIGAWMQRIAQDWLVLTELTHHDAAAVGLVTALQFLPPLLLFPWTGHAADHLDRRKLLILTQSALGLLALGLGLLTVTGAVRLWHVYVFALLLGCATAFDAPARQTFVGDMVGEGDLANAVAINATSFNASRLVGPAISGLLIAAVGSGTVFLINAASFLAVLVSLMAMRTADLHPAPRPPAEGGRLAAGLRYVAARSDLKALFVMLFLFGSFCLNFTVVISAMSVKTFHLDADGFGLLTSALAVGTVTGAVLAARRERPTLALIAGGLGMFAVANAVAAIAPGEIWFGLILIPVGIAAQTVTTSTVALLQISTDRVMRGRVMALALTLSLGGQPIGSPLSGWIANTAGPRWAMAFSAFVGLVAAGIGLRYILRNRQGLVTEPEESAAG